MFDLIRSGAAGNTTQKCENRSTDFFNRNGKELMDRLASRHDGCALPATIVHRRRPFNGRQARQQQLAASVETFSGILGGADLLNYSTYSLMKERAGTVGRRGVLRQLKALDVVCASASSGAASAAASSAATADGPAGHTFGSTRSTLLQAAFPATAFGAKFEWTAAEP